MKEVLCHIILFICLILGIVEYGVSQNNYYNFSHLSINDGLAHNHCFSILKDKNGFMWFGTESGLSRYDGQNFKNYRHIEGDSTSLGGNRINDIVQDKSGELWIAVQRGGLNRYNPVNDKFTIYKLEVNDTLDLPSVELSCLYLDSKGEIWYGTYRHGFGKFNKATQTFENYNLSTNFKNPRNAWEINSAVSIFEDISNENILWIGSLRAGLYKFDKKTKSLEHFINKDDKNSGIHDFYMEEPDELWVGYWGAGLGKFDTKNKTWKMFFPDSIKYLIGDGYTNVCVGIEKKSNTEFWIAGGRDGIGVFNKVSKQFKFFDQSKIVNPEAGQGFVSEIQTDFNDGLWICDKTNGIYQIDPSRQSFKNISTKAIKYRSRAGLNAANDFAYNPVDKKYYVATGNGDGLYIFNKEKKLIETSTSILPSKYMYYQFTDLMIDSKNKIWVIDRTHNELLQYDHKSNICKPYPLKKFKNYPKSSFTLSAFIEDLQGNIWIGTQYGGLIKFNPDTNTFTQFIGSNPSKELTSKAGITDILISKDNRIWMGTINYGIYIFNPQTEKFTSFQPQIKGGLIENRVHALGQDKNGNIWAGLYTKGIQIINPEKGSDQNINLLTFHEGLKNENVVNIITDLHQNMWVQTEGGLFPYDYTSGKFSKYDDKDGYNDYLNPYGMTSLSTGEICVGGSEGFIIFHPDSIYKNITPPKVVLTGFSVGEKETKFDKRIDYISEIELPYQDNFFTFNFAALNFQLPIKNSYAYKLEGVDNDWVYSGNRNYASYTNISEGTYLFKVKASNNNSIWNEIGTSISIKIFPPWYRSWLAYLIYGLFLTAGIYSFYYYQKRRWYLKTQLQLEHEEAKRFKELDAAKSKIYTNITHEFRTPLTVILGLANQILIDPKDMLKDKIKLIRRNGKSLLQLINQMLDLAKLETGNLKTEMINSDIVGYLGYLTESFHSLANDKGIHLNFYSEKKEIFMDFDPDKIERIVTNLISNAIKFTPKYGKVLVISKVDKISNDSNLIIEVQDNGKGISQENIKRIFDRFQQIDDAHTRNEGGTGIGLALVHELVQLLNGNIEVKSEIEAGSTFIITLPIKMLAKRTDLPILEIPSAKTHESDLNIEPIVSDKKISPDKSLLLIIEDNQDVIYYLNTFLNKAYNVEFASNGEKGIKKALEIIPDIIISDVMMPKKDGFEVCQELKSNQLTSHIPIILLTAKATANDRLSGLKHGADAYLMKPFNQEELEIRLEQLIKSRQKLQEYYSNLSDKQEEVSEETKRGIEFLNKLKSKIIKNIEKENFDVVYLSREMHMSRSQLHRKLKALTNTTPALYIRKVRLEKALKFLKETDKPISDIAFELGFKSPSYFSYSFNEEYGFNPSEVRK